MADDDINVRDLGPAFEEVLRREARSVVRASVVAASLTGLRRRRRIGVCTGPRRGGQRRAGGARGRSCPVCGA